MGRGAGVSLLSTVALFVFMPADRESESAGNENRLRIHCPMFMNWVEVEKGSSAAVTFGGSALGMHASG